MDDLLKVFFWETSECIAACRLAVDRLRQVPDDLDSLEDMLEQFRTMRETAGFLGMSALQAAAGAVLDSLESAHTNRPGAMDRVLSLAVDGLRRIEAVVKGMMIADAAMAEEPPRAKPPARGAAGSGAEGLRSKAGIRGAGALRGQMTTVAARGGDGNRVEPAAPDGNAGSLLDVAAARRREPVGAATTPAPARNEAAGGTVQIDAATLDYLVSTVKNLAATQAELMRMLAAKENNATPASAEATPTPSASAAPAGDSAGEGAKHTAAEPAADLPEMVRYLVFRAADGSRGAVRLDRVASLEEVELKAVDKTRGFWVMRWSGELLPLIPFDRAYQLPVSGRAPVIVFQIGGHSFGLLVESVPEVADVAAPAAAADALSVPVAGQSVKVIDPTSYFEQALGGRLGRRRRGSSKSPRPAESPPLAIPAGDDLFVRKTGH